MEFEIRRQKSASLATYASVPIGFAISEVVDTTTLRPGQSAFSTKAVHPRTKDYDAIPGNHPGTWPDRFPVEQWVILAAYSQRGERIGAAVVIVDPEGIARAGGRTEHAVLWDLRISPFVHGQGVGRALLSAAMDAARAAGCRGLDAETQDVNAAACRFYAANGFVLSAVEPRAYPDEPEETKLIWTRTLANDIR